MHYLKINDSDKKKIGYLIHLYRTQQFKHLSQNSFLLNEYNEPICTRQTLSKIEQGIIIKNDSIYEELLKKVNLKFNTDYCIEEFLPTSIFSDLLNACDYYNLEKLISISESYIKQLNPFKEYIFFHEYYECFKWIYTYYSSFELPTLQSTEYIISLKNIINSNLYEVMIDLVFKKRTISGIYDFSYFDFKNSNSMINRGNHMMILYNQSKLSEMLDYCQDLEEEYSSKNNYIRLLDIYSLKGFAFSNTEKEKFEKLVSQINHTVEAHNSNIPKIKISQLLKNIGLQAFRIDMYDIAINYLEQYIAMDSPYANIVGIDLCISYQKTNKINQLKSFIQSKEVYKGDSQYENLLNYFILKYKYQTDNDELSYFIVNKVPIIIDNTMGKYKQFFYEELSMLVGQNKRYKDLKTYLDSTSDMLPI
ncbi:hypothetical protein [Holdemanella biformis]|uniref:Uncharacterized protein n=1 Tax=Holdemanella biformis TaxID=1735 RepID=A0A395W882_9FIRM|nr:hypothetical protein [Holdemanella biformis]MCC3354056.1 hypothetical protein [Holdemanella biformis]RGU73382.1 hypothetical protein DWW49_01970 [Holdemanella biformis]RGU93011.1 hypothetical protein DWW32_03285 [Holdemanella biformis]